MSWINPARFPAITAASVLTVIAVPSAAAVQSGSQSVTSTITNGSFEQPSLSANPPPKFGPHATVDLPYYVYPHQAKAKWIYVKGAGVINTSSGFNPFYGNAPPTGFVGQQFAFVQGNGLLKQSFNVTSSGTYQIAWLDAGRPAGATYDGNQTYNLVVNGAVVGSFSTVSGQNFGPHGVQVSLQAGTNVLLFIGTTKADHTAFLDAVAVTTAQ